MDTESYKMPIKEMYLGDTEIVLSSPFIREEVNALKKTVPSSRWDRIAEVWRIPVIDRDAALEYAETWDYEVTEELKRLNLPKNTTNIKTVKIDGENVVIKFPYDPIMVSAVKLVPGVRWHSNTQSWLAPLAALSKAVAFAIEYKLEVDPFLIEEVERLDKSASRAMEASKAVEGTLTVPGLMLDLYPYQRAGVAYAAEKRRTFIADDMGLGKTLQALASIELSDNYPCVVVCPPKLTLDWETKIKEALPHRTTHVVHGRGDFPEHETDYTILGFSNISHHTKPLLQKKYQSAIFDESQAYINNKSQRTIAAKKIAKNVPIGNMVLLLTGTPISSKPSNFGPQLDILGRIKQFGGLWSFYKRFCGAYQDTYGQWHKDGANSANLEELNEILRQTCYVRRLKTEVMKDLPDIIEDTVYVEMSDKWQKEYNAAKTDIVKYFQKIKAEAAKELGENATEAQIASKIVAGNHLVQLSQLRKIVANAKMDAAKEWITARKEENNKIIIAAHHKEITSKLAAQTGNLKIVGGQPVKSVEQDKHTFQTETCQEAPAIVISITAAQTGHTLTAAQHILFVEQPWTPGAIDQVMSRAHRNGQKGTVQATTLIIPNTIDEKIQKMIKQKREIIKLSTDGTTKHNLTETTALTLLEDII